MFFFSLRSNALQKAEDFCEAFSASRPFFMIFHPKKDSFYSKAFKKIHKVDFSLKKTKKVVKPFAKMKQETGDRSLIITFCPFGDTLVHCIQASG